VVCTPVRPEHNDAPMGDSLSGTSSLQSITGAPRGRYLWRWLAIARLRPLLWLVHTVRVWGKVANRPGGPFVGSSMCMGSADLSSPPRLGGGPIGPPGGAPPYGGRAACRGPFDGSSMWHGIRGSVKRSAGGPREPLTETRGMRAHEPVWHGLPRPSSLPAKSHESHRDGLSLI
jgi:hypothetical protein